ncbi:MAG TPA: hypothetical protein VMV92_29730 [Streptosporangiaceae bacterium]|nr:hypothetical protein [Streptosporangiaceae bacterium]
MRHLIGMVLAIVMAGVLFFAGSWGYLRLLRLTAPSVPLSQLPAGGGSLIADHGVLAALIAVAGTGLLAGILVAVPRISPLAAGLPGLLLLGLTALYLVSVRHAVSLIPLKSHSFGAGFEAMLFDGILGAAGLAMIIPAFVPARWRGRGNLAESEATGDSEFISRLAETTESQEPAEDPEPVYQPRAAGSPPSPVHHGPPLS